MAGSVPRAGAGVILMHSRGGVGDMGTYRHANYGRDVVGEVMAELWAGCDAAQSARRRSATRIALDPGVGFAKRSEHSLAVMSARSRGGGAGISGGDGRFAQAVHWRD